MLKIDLRLDRVTLDNRYKDFFNDKKMNYIMNEAIAEEIKPYVPKDTGELEGSLMIDDKGMTWNAPYSKYVWNGKTFSGEEMTYNKDNNPKAGPRWTERYLADNSGELKKYLTERGVKK